MQSGENDKLKVFLPNFRPVCSMGVAPLQSLLLQQQTGRVSEVGPFFLFFFFPLRFLLLDVTLCHSHSWYAALSISIIAAPLGRGETSKPLFVCECGCLCIKEGCPCSFHAHLWQTVSVCASACLCMFCVRLCVFCSLLLLHCHPSVCRLPKPEAPVGFWGASGRKRNDWAITLLLLSPQRCSSPPRLVFFQEVFAARGFFFFALFHSLALC